MSLSLSSVCDACDSNIERVDGKSNGCFCVRDAVESRMCCEASTLYDDNRLEFRAEQFCSSHPLSFSRKRWIPCAPLRRLFTGVYNL